MNEEQKAMTRDLANGRPGRYTPDPKHDAAEERTNPQHAGITVPPLTDDMLRYAMGAMGTGSPADAERFRLFWQFASEAAARPIR